MAEKDINKEIKKLIGTKNLLTGTKETLKALRIGSAKTIILSSNCPADVKNDIKYYANLSKAEVIESDKTNIELGVLCKKQHPISVLSIT